MKTRLLCWSLVLASSLALAACGHKNGDEDDTGAGTSGAATSATAPAVANTAMTPPATATTAMTPPATMPPPSSTAMTPPASSGSTH